MYAAADLLVEAGMDEAARVLMANVWQPIETAPTMRTVLLARVFDDGNWNVHSGWAWDTGGFYWDGRTIETFEHQPTHWCQIPNPPEPQT